MSQTTNDIENKEQKLILPSGKSVLLPFSVRETLTFGNVIIALLEVPSNTQMNENVFGVGSNGQILWQIEKKPSPYKSSPYLDLNRDGDNAKVGNWDGMEYIIEPHTGKILEERYTK